MRLLVAAVLAAAACAAPARAVTVWQGTATVTAASPACQSAVTERTTIDVGTVLRTVLRPKGVSDNGEEARLSFVHDGQASFVIFMPGGAASGTYSAFGANHRGLIMANRSGAYRRLVLSPRAPTASTEFLTASGSVQDFMFIEGCTVTFDAAYTLRE